MTDYPAPAKAAKGSPGAATPKPNPNAPPMDVRPAPQTERQFLSRQAEDAGLAVRAAFADAKRHAADSARHAANSVDPRLLTAARPWVAVAGAAAAGLAGGLVFVPSREKQVARRLATIERLISAEQKVAGRPVASAGGSFLKQGWVNQALRIGLNYARPAIVSAITGAIAAKATAADTAEDVASDNG